MPKNKRAKHSHPNRGGANGPNNNNHGGAANNNNNGLSHAEVWDDSALIRSWNEAVREYEYYHSLAAQGLDVDAVLDAAEAAEANGVEVPLALGDDGGETDAPAAIDQNSLPAEGDGGEVEDGGVAEENGDGAEQQQQAGTQISSKAVATAAASGTAARQQREPTDAEREAALRRLGVADTRASGGGGGGGGGSEAITAASSGLAASAEDTLENLKMAYYWAGYYSGLYDQQRGGKGDGGGSTGASG